ncbi:YfjI family protein [Microlunatus sp. GCM10028923]|uniref:YfjI family protein n=1 Tax=Microlunatus sp. GCM10028923 TaxID=3273400 RepID=UPI00360B1D5C
MTDQAPVRYLHPVEPAHAAESSVTEGPAGWEPYLPLTPERQLPQFPLDGVPGWLADMITETATALQVPIDLPATLGLAGLAVAAGGRVDVSPIPGWVEPTNLYTVIALAPGSRKSPTFNAMTQPLRDAEQALCDATETQRIQASLEARRIRAQAEKAARAAELADKDPDAAMAEAMATAQDAYELIEQPEPRLLADDLTPETAASLLAQHGGRLGILSAEGGSFATVAGVRYSTAPNLETLLKAHAGDMIRIDRKGRPAERIERPALTIAITTQPGNLATIARTPEARERGLLARFLYCLPVNTVGRRQIHPPPVTEPTRNAYAAHLHGLVLDLAQLDQRAELACDPGAVRVLEDLETWLEPQLHPETGALAAISDWASKMAGAALRLAGLLHLAETGADGITEPITEATMTAAVGLARYYLAHAQATFDALTADPAHKTAKRVLDWLTTNAAATFTRRELQRGLSNVKADDLTGPLALLTEHGYIRQRQPAGRTTGRPSTTYETHPGVVQGAFVSETAHSVETGPDTKTSR